MPHRSSDMAAETRSTRRHGDTEGGQSNCLPPVDTCTLDHGGCITCADAGIPVRVIAVDGDDALCEDGAGNRASIAVELVGLVRPGDGLLTHGGVAIGRIVV